MHLIGYDSDSVADDYFRGNYKKLVRLKPPKGISRKNYLLSVGAQCYICSRVLTNSNFTWDHVHPKSKGGKLKRECCKSCNWEKKDMTVAEYIEFLTGRNDVVSLQKAERLLRVNVLR